MKKFLVVFLVLFVSFIVFGQTDDGTVGPGTSKPTEQSVASSADWYTMKTLTVAGGAILTVGTTYPGYLLKGIYNNSDTTASAVLITKQGDTVTLRIPALTYPMKLPVISKVIGTGTSGSLVYLFQKR